MADTFTEDIGSDRAAFATLSALSFPEPSTIVKIFFYRYVVFMLFMADMSNFEFSRAELGFTTSQIL